VRRVRDDRDTDGGKVGLNFGDVALLLLTIAKMFLLVLDGSASTSHVGRRK
jgi:hypothetical protein